MGVHNLSSFFLNRHQLKVLSYGRKFIPTPLPLPFFTLNNYLKDYTRSVRINFQFGNDENQRSKFWIKNDKFIPNSLFLFPVIENYLKKFELIITNNNFPLIAKNTYRWV